MRARVVGGVVAAATLITACSGADPDEGLVRAEGVDPRVVAVGEAAALTDVVDATRTIATALLDAAPEEGNVVVSPSSVAVALSMLADGARGDSLAELESVLGASGEDRRDAFTALRSALLEYDGDPAVVQDDDLPDRPMIHLADQVVVDDELDVERGYLEALAAGFDAGVQHADLGSPEGKSTLDAWVRHHTGGLVEKSAIQPRSDLRLVLQDAVVLAARWQTPFDGRGTYERPFTLSDGSVVDAQTMAVAEPFAYAEVDGWTAARLPYVDALHADVLLPPAGVDPAAVTPELLAAVDSALSAAEPEPVDLWLPKLDVTPDPLDLTATIDRLGAGSVLAPETSDLTGIAPPEAQLFVGQAAQQAVLKVDEEGTVAAAVTEVGVEAGSAVVRPTRRTLHLDRPFVLMVCHTETSWPLFLATIRDPRH